MSASTTRAPTHATCLLDGAGPAATGAILGAAIPLVLALHETWQFSVLAAAALALLALPAALVYLVYKVREERAGAAEHRAEAVAPGGPAVPTTVH